MVGLIKDTRFSSGVRTCICPFTLLEYPPRENLYHVESIILTLAGRYILFNILFFFISTFPSAVSKYVVCTCRVRLAEKKSLSSPLPCLRTILGAQTVTIFYSRRVGVVH